MDRVLIDLHSKKIIDYAFSHNTYTKVKKNPCSPPSDGFSPLSCLPNELLFHIFIWLDIASIYRFGLTNSKYALFLESQNMWKHLFVRRFPPESLPTDQEFNWKALFKATREGSSQRKRKRAELRCNVRHNGCWHCEYCDITSYSGMFSQERPPSSRKKQGIII